MIECINCGFKKEPEGDDILSCEKCKGKYWKPVSNILKCQRCDLCMKHAEELNPAHICMGSGCDKYLGHRGYCSTKCHDSHYDDLDS